MNECERISKRITDECIIAVIRLKDESSVEPMAEALLAGGVTVLEITTTVPGAIEVVGRLSAQLKSRAAIGVGTVLDTQTCAAALEAGADFVVTPVMKPEIAAMARSADRPVMLGAYTPTEAQNAWEAGADFVKIFPADKLGPGYIKALRAPLPHLKMVPTGGVNLENTAEFIKAGAAALGIGSALVPPILVEEKRWSDLTDLARAYTRAVGAARVEEAVLKRCSE
ncbi:MAG: bifunctional 4-hydroxy-2-oxoglutarate aldolase/2-dehydro-3-deoxy-phosphogluconate aldolase [Verrucomicrobia bacterium]|nr:bifunctional 4-hydroxy-2-oxoglutarate aldolase/2-dehydro-3-deoxy-phosphogluconate aldolase [Verrucomicrobiota bacterium]